MDKTQPHVGLVELLGLFLKLGLTAFGGPAAHISMMEEEVVSRRHWVTRQEFLDLVGATNLIPGPNSTEMVIHIGYLLRSWAGLVVSGCAFILPAAVITLFFAFSYVRWGSIPEVGALLFGVKPAVVFIILAALLRLGRKAVKSADVAVIGVAVVVVALMGGDPVLLLLAAGIVGAFWISLRKSALFRVIAFPVLWMGLVVPVQTSKPPLLQLFLYFLKVGSVLFGSGYVLVAYLERGLVQELGWMTQSQLLDAIAVGQLTPGPVLSAATFVGFVCGGIPGAVVATLGIFLPSFVFVVLLRPWVPRLRENPWTARFLDSVNVAAVALMVAVVISLGRSSLTGWRQWLLFGMACLLGGYFRLSSPYLVLASALAGLGLRLLAWN